jgi:hypothetical protein
MRVGAIVSQPRKPEANILDGDTNDEPFDTRLNRIQNEKIAMPDSVGSFHLHGSVISISAYLSSPGKYQASDHVRRSSIAHHFFCCTNSTPVS